ncbi:LysM peptidoglycan-binding domain-containing protein [Rossellomorea aquimaris]|uniref:C40 family peptidase n=1 Tax=Rossellomorea aquimaris TaxID=189382 RepID=UPI001CFD8428|nr:peptidoglycan endopeptidase [Rossellomorea aquimaris]
MKKTIFVATTTALLSTAFVTAASADTHRVGPGDSLWSISKKYNVQIADLKEWNALEKDIIYPNQTLKVLSSPAKMKTPAPVKAPKPSMKTAPSSKVKEYKVQPGDTLSEIAQKHSVKLKDLLEWNPGTSSLIYPGQTIKLASSASAKAPAKNVSKTTKPAVPSPASPDRYMVKSGDTLSAISVRLNVNVQDLKEWNQLSTDMIYVGQELKVNSTVSRTNPTPSPLPAKENVSSSSVIDNAKSLLGTPYLWGGKTIEGFDCSGFIYYVYNQSGKTINRYSSEGYYNRSFYVNTPQVGDLVFFENTYKKGISHLGIYAGDNQFIHASDFGVTITSLSDPYWASKFDGFKRFY